MQGNNYGILVKNDKKNSPNHLFGQPEGFSLLTGTEYAVRLIVLPFKLQRDREFVNYVQDLFPFIYKTVLLCVIFKSE